MPISRFLVRFLIIKNKIVKISDALTHSNEAQNDDDVNPSKPFTRFEEGQSTSAIWAVRSLGIDPETGDELFLNRKGRDLRMEY